MSADLLARLPGTKPWLRATFTPKVELRARKALRVLERSADARATAFWISSGHGDELIAFTGDRSAIPRRFPHVDATVPTYEEFVLECRERIPAVVHAVQLGKGLPMMRVAAIAPGPADSARLFDAIEDCAERLEEITVAAL